jgi:hypothetical protein
VLLGRVIELPEADLPEAFGEALRLGRRHQEVEVARAAEAVRREALQAKGKELERDDRDVQLRGLRGHALRERGEALGPAADGLVTGERAAGESRPELAVE